MTLEQLEEGYTQELDIYPDNTPLRYLANTIFNFTLYDDDMEELFAIRMLQTLKHILNHTQGDYFMDDNNYNNYLTMVNMPYLEGKLNWGTSIRGAFFEKECVEEIKNIIEWIKLKPNE